MRIHHNTLKKALKFGIRLVAGDKAVTAFEGDVALATASDPKDALDLAIEALKDEDGADEAVEIEAADDELDPSDDELQPADEDGGASVVKSKYQERYRPNKGHCGDDLAVKLRDTFLTKENPDTGRRCLDFNAFVAFAKANEVWVESYRQLKDRHGNRNDGLIRMNVANRLRAKLRKGAKVKW